MSQATVEFEAVPISVSCESPRICLVSPGHVASNPRLVKEADALHHAGYNVRVVAGDYMAAIRPLDETLLSKVSWQWTQVGLGSKWGYWFRRIRQEAAKKLASVGILPLSVATWAHSPMSLRLARIAAAEPADLYIGHCLAALPAVAYAARKHGSKFGFDAEDFHVGELSNLSKNRTEVAVRDFLEKTLLPSCVHLTAASPGIAAAYADRYGIKMQPILNVFPQKDCTKKQRDITDSEIHIASQCSSKLSLYWFSQTIGPGRGLELVIQAMGQMTIATKLCLRGFISEEYRRSLLRLAQSVGLNDQITFLPSAPPEEMVALASVHDVGLSVEPGRDTNNDICLGNKIFTYLLAGIPLLMSNTTAQTELAKDLGEAAMLIDLEKADDVAAVLDSLLADSARLTKMKTIADELGRSRYNWEIEQHSFLNSVKQALAR
ncbi:MAG: glycosyltransferase [Phormidesmis sp.]